MKSLSKLLDLSQVARESGDWVKLEEISITILRGIFSGNVVKEDTLKKIIINYLSSIVGTGDFLLELSDKKSKKYLDGLEKLNQFLTKRPHFYNSIDPIIQSGREIALLALDPTSQNRNKISKNLRKVARPDLAVEICLQILETTRLNYYTLTVLCGAYCDLGNFDSAIEVAQRALKYEPDSGKTFVLNSLVRAHTLKFKSNGDFNEIDFALKFAHESINIKLDAYSANAYIAAAVASTYDHEIQNAKKVLLLAEPELKIADINALIQSAKAIEASTPKSIGIELFDELDDDSFTGGFDSLVDLVLRDEGFIPDIENVRQMIPRFKSGGWFLQGLSNIPCPNCNTIAIHSYRKHFGRYGKEMHYWGLVCDFCKRAIDSQGFDKKYFALISADLEQSFPVAGLCTICTLSITVND